MELWNRGGLPAALYVLARGLVAILLAVAASRAHAGELCTVGEKLRRDGIVAVPLPPDSPQTPALTLTSLGIIRDAQSRPHQSVWRIANAGGTPVRVTIETSNGRQRISVLARARQETYVRSDEIDGTVAHRLMFGGAQIASQRMTEAQYADTRTLRGNACAFEGNPLYVAGQNGLRKVSTLHGASVAEVAPGVDVELLAIEHPRGNTWIMSGGELRSYDPFGAPVGVLNVGTLAVAAGERHLAIGSAEAIWLARDSTLYRVAVSAGGVIGSLVFDEPIRGLSMDVRRGRVWVLLDSSVRIFRPKDDAPQRMSESASFRLPAPGRTLAYDAYWSETWVGSTTGLKRYDGAGAETASLSGLTVMPADHLAPDGAGGLWGMHGSALFHVNGGGVVDAQLEPFASSSESVVDLVSDPADGSAWVASVTRLRNFSRTSGLILDVIPGSTDGVARQLRSLALFADRTPPSIKIVSPSEGSTVATPRPPLELTFSDPGGEVAVDTLELLLGGAPLPANCVPANGGSVCVPSADLAAGVTTVSPQVLDLAGNESDPRPRTFTIAGGAPLPPRVPNLALIQIAAAGDDGLAVISGRAGAVEAGVRVWVTNVRTGARVSAIANSAGEFIARIAAEPTDAIQVRAENAAGHRSDPAGSTVPGQPLAVTVTQPLPGAVVADRHVLAIGAVAGPVGTGVTVNGIAAILTTRGATRSFAVQIPLEPGLNLLEIIATTPQGHTARHAVTVNRAGETPFAITTSAADGIAPLTVEFGIDRYSPLAPVAISMDFDGDGIVDQSISAIEDVVAHTYAQPGAFIAGVTVTTAEGQSYSYRVPITVQSTAQIDARVRAVWAQMMNAFAAQDDAAALRLVAPGSVQRFAPIFTQLRETLPQIATGIAEPVQAVTYSSYAEYAITRTIAGVQRVFLITFVRNADGVWRFAGM